jgi:hypothetical protein
MADAKKEWAGFAEEIKAGKRKSFAQHLEERGLLHDVVGYVHICAADGSLNAPLPFTDCWSGFAGSEIYCTASLPRKELVSTQA